MNLFHGLGLLVVLPVPYRNGAATRQITTEESGVAQPPPRCTIPRDAGRADRCATCSVTLLQYGDLSFRDFVELALYHPEFGYYARAENPVGKGGGLRHRALAQPGVFVRFWQPRPRIREPHEGAVCSIVDIGCGDGGLIESVGRCQLPVASAVRFFGVDRELGRRRVDSTTTQPRLRPHARRAPARRRPSLFSATSSTTRFPSRGSSSAASTCTSCG